MKFALLLLTAALVSMVRPAAGQESFQSTLQRSAPTQPSQYSFADLYQVTVSAPLAAALPAAAPADSAVRIAAAQAPAQFSVADAAEPKLGLLLLAGFAAAFWVARRRLGYAP